MNLTRAELLTWRAEVKRDLQHTEYELSKLTALLAWLAVEIAKAEA